MIERPHDLDSQAPGEFGHSGALMDAIRDELPGVLTRFRGDAEGRFLTRFAAASDDRRLIALTAPRNERTGRLLALRRGEHIGLMFRRGAITYVFTSVVANADRTPSRSSGELISVNWPAHVQIVHRRLHDRFVPPANQAIRVLLWGDADGARRPRAHRRQVKHERAASGLLSDLSVGGMRLRTSHATPMEVGATVKCAFKVPAAGPVKCSARLRNIEHHTDGTRSMGFEFTGVHAGLDGPCRAARLAAITSQFRRSVTG
jgi:c-di-GMP-binding flagellar brake protein YcgR